MGRQMILRNPLTRSAPQMINQIFQPHFQGCQIRQTSRNTLFSFATDWPAISMCSPTQQDQGHRLRGLEIDFIQLNDRTKTPHNRDSKTNFSNGKSCKLIPKQASKMYEADIDNPAAQTWLTDDPETARNPSANATMRVRQRT